MIKLTDGPAAGSYAVKRAPLYLRAVVAADGKKDVLDQLDDEPRNDEDVHVYLRQGEAGTVHIQFGGKARNATGFYATGTYVHVREVNSFVRDAADWRAWVEGQTGVKVDPATGTPAVDGQ